MGISTVSKPHSLKVGKRLVLSVVNGDVNRKVLIPILIARITGEVSSLPFAVKVFRRQTEECLASRDGSPRILQVPRYPDFGGASWLPFQTMFRPCIDLHEGKVKQIVGGSLTDQGDALKTNFTADRPSEWYADLYRRDGLSGGHVIMLGPGNESAACSALGAYPGGLQVGGGIRPLNAKTYLDIGASHVIVTSWLFDGAEFSQEKLQLLAETVGRNRLIVDLSCRARGDDYYVVTNRWQTFTSLSLSAATLERLAEFCDEFLIHAADVEGLCQGIDLNLVEKLSRWSPIPTTYAGGASSMADLETITSVSKGRVHLTIGSALDIFGGSGVRYADALAFNRANG